MDCCILVAAASTLKNASKTAPPMTAGSNRPPLSPFSSLDIPTNATSLLLISLFAFLASPATSRIALEASSIAWLKIPDLNPRRCIIPPRPSTTAPVTPVALVISF